MSSKIKIPQKLPCLHVTDGIIFPGASHKIPVRAQMNINMVDDCLMDIASMGSNVICIVYKEPNNNKTGLNGLHEIATAAVVTQVVGTNWPRPSYSVQVSGLCRVKIEEILQNKPYTIASIRQLSTEGKENEFDSKTFRQTLSKFLTVLQNSNVSTAKLRNVLSTSSLDFIVDLTASIVESSYETKLTILDALDLKIRAKIVENLLIKQIEKMEKLNDDKESFTVDLYPEAFRSDELKKILNSFGHRLKFGNDGERPLSRQGTMSVDDDEKRNGDVLAKKLKDAKMPPEVEKIAMEELKKLNSMMPMMPEYSMLRNYLELMADLPWSKETKDTLELTKAKKDLDDDHYGLDDVKKRILEYLAVRRLKNNLKGPILCFVGPPGVGKTSIGRSVARTLGRQFHRISVGGVCDQSDIRGHRRTYIGAMPGRIMNGLKVAQSKNPVFLLDEVDKMSAGVHGDPTAALLEVLDPEQNSTFVDHYLNVPFDLSQVLFIATANSVAGIPAPLLDRMELVQIAGYTVEEKIRIGQKYLVPKQMREHGLTADHLTLPESTLRDIAHKYTREAGVRNFERKLGAIMRAVALKFAEKRSDSSDVVDRKLTKNLDDWPIVIDEIALNDILGAPVYAHETREMLSTQGVVAGLAWTPVGGEIMYVETSKNDGEGKLTLTGQLGEVMQESVRIGLSWLRSHASHFGIQINESTDFLEHTDLHVHFPAGAVSKDGPSAGVTIVTALVSLFTNKCVRSDTAMTGEITLRGLVLPVGGIKEKVLAANRAGFTRVILPRKNEKDVTTLPSEVKESLAIIYADTIEDVMRAAFDEGMPKMNTKLIQSKL